MKELPPELLAEVQARLPQLRAALARMDSKMADYRRTRVRYHGGPLDGIEHLVDERSRDGETLGLCVETRGEGFIQLLYQRRDGEWTWAGYASNATASPRTSAG